MTCFCFSLLRYIFFPTPSPLLLFYDLLSLIMVLRCFLVFDLLLILDHLIFLISLLLFSYFSMLILSHRNARFFLVRDFHLLHLLFIYPTYWITISFSMLLFLFSHVFFRLYYISKFSLFVPVSFFSTFTYLLLYLRY